MKTSMITILASALVTGAAAKLLPPPPPPVTAAHPAHLVLTRTSEVVPATSDPVWALQLVVDDRVVGSLPALVGHADRQRLNRNTAGNKSPLPAGAYGIERAGIEQGPFGNPELGHGYWIPVSPRFATGRSALGIHQDPSWGLRNGESGTSGCIGLRSAQDTRTLVRWIREHGVSSLVVTS